MNIIKSTGTFSIFILISRILGYVRDFFIAIYLGSGPLADAFFVAFRVPNTFRRLFSEGTFNAAFVPSYSIELSKGKIKAREFAKDPAKFSKSVRPASMYVVVRSLGQVVKKLKNMEQTNFRHRQKMSKLKFEELPDAATEPEKIINKGQLSILYLKGYENLPASAIVSILLENLFKHRQEVEEENPPFLTIIEEAHNFIPSRSEDKDNLPSVETIRKVITEGRKFGTGVMIISQRPSRLDETIASQCNSQIVFRMVNQKDQRATTRDSETLSVDDSKQLPNLANGQGIISGQVVNFSLPVQIKFDADLINDDIGNENFITAVENWDDKESVKQRKKFAKDFSNITSIDRRRTN